MKDSLLKDLFTQFISSNWDMKGKRFQNLGLSKENRDSLTRGEILDQSGKLKALDGSALINLNASNISSGTLASARLDITKGAWIPTNAHVTLTVNHAAYWHIDNITFIQADLTWPVTANANDATIVGLPFAPVGWNGLSIGYDDSGIILFVTANGSGIIPWKAGPATVKNVDLSTKNLIISGWFEN